MEQKFTKNVCQSRFNTIMHQIKDYIDDGFDSTENKYWLQAYENLQKQKETLQSKENAFTHEHDLIEEDMHEDLNTAFLESFNITIDEFPILDIYPKCKVYFQFDNK